MTGVVAALQDLDLRVVEDVVGSAAFRRGRTYADTRVLELDWHDDDLSLTATVQGNGHVYETVAFFASSGAQGIVFLEGECSCPVGYECKHVAAIVMAAVGTGQQRPSTAPASRLRARPAEPTWEDALTSLLPSTSGIDAPATPLAIEISLDWANSGSANPRLNARLLRQGRKGWVKTGVSWGELDEWQVRQHDLDQAQVRVARELQALHQATTRRSAYYGYGSEKVIDLAVLDRSVWALLDEAAQVGLQLVYATPALGAVDPYRNGALCLDVTRAPDGGLQIAPQLQLEDAAADASVVGFLGSSGHGVIYAPPAQPEGGIAGIDRFGLARLARSVPEALQRLTFRGEPLHVPAADEARFTELLWPRLRHVATVVSSDGAFVAPTISAPRLELEARYGEAHTLALSWAWAYDVGDTTHRVGIGAGADASAGGFRDRDAEQEMLDALDLDVLDRFGRAGAVAFGAVAELAGLDTMRFTTEALPLLVDDPRISVEVVGEPADFREVGDSLTIGLSTQEVRGETDWFDLGITITVEGRELAFGELFVALASGEPELLLADGAYFSLHKPELEALRRLIDEARALQDAPADTLRISRYQVSWWEELCEIGVVGRQAEAWHDQVSALRAIESIGEADVPASLTAELRPYQRDGFAWLSFLWEHRLGGVLADDMGLGKTVQVLALICHARASDPGLGPFLVVAPTSVVPNWAAEAQRFAPDLSFVTVTDTLRRSGRTIGEVVTGADVVVTSYTLARLDDEALRTVEWAGLLLDEAQQAKNHRSKIYGCLRQLPAPFKLAITGTPMENNVMELWSLLSITAPGLFPNPTRFAEHYARPIERHGDVEALAQLRRRIKPLVKRRTKELVADELPAKQEQVIDVELHPKHRKVYERHLQRERQKVLGLLDKDFDRNRFTILRSITLLRQLSLHPMLVDPAHAAVPCAKIDLLTEQLAEVAAGGHRALVFSQFTTFLREVRGRLEGEGVTTCYLDGRTRKRGEVIQRFKDGDATAFLISLKAGGVGLNLTEADYCFLLDPWWNPATEAQAVDRSHRIGQTRAVMVYRMIAAGTIEEKVQALKERKAKLFSGVMDDGDFFGGRLEADDVRGLFS